MPIKYRPEKIKNELFIGQFILTAEEKEAPAGWQTFENQNWKLFTLGLPVINVYNQSHQWLGWCIGYPILNGCINPLQVELCTASDAFDPSSVEQFYNNVSGKWALLLVRSGIEKVYLDPYGSLSMVYSTIERTAASTASLFNEKHIWDEDLINAVGLPENDSWLPSGLTSKKHVRRLLPNHCLNIKEWKAMRHWPTPHTDLSINFNTRTASEKIANIIQNTISAVSKEYPVCFSLTAGMDSRMLLGCARNHLDNASFFTFATKKNTVDRHIPELLAKRYKLNHKFLHPEEASEDELKHWLALTGFSTAGAIWKIHKTLERLDANRVLLPGTAGEVGRRTLQWRSTDHLGTQITALDVLTRCKLPHHPAMIHATEEWLAELQFLDIFSILALIFIEQRLGCWAAPQHYGNTTSVFEFTPFNNRQIFHTTLRLPHEYRRQKQLPIDICRYTWPELLELPFNEFTGMKGYLFSKARNVKKFMKEIINK